MIDLSIRVNAKIDPVEWAEAYGIALTASAIEEDVLGYLAQPDIIAGLNEVGGFGSNVIVKSLLVDSTGTALTGDLRPTDMKLSLVVTAQVDPEVWALEYGFPAQDLAAIEADVRVYLDQTAEIADHLNDRKPFGPNVTITQIRPAELVAQ